MAARALVLGGGGVAGIAWELGLLSGWAADGVDVTSADLVVGTSAGSVVGAQLRLTGDVQALYERQLLPPLGEKKVDFDGVSTMTAFTEAMKGATGEQDARARLGRVALAVDAVPEAERRAIIEGRIGDPEWPAGRLVITAVDTADGEFLPFDASSGVRLLDAVTASCAVPGVWPPVTVDGRRLMDGGMRSVTNADLATGCDKVLIITPTRGMPGGLLGPGLDREISVLEKEAEVLVITADEASLAAFGSNVLDPATREPSARAGRAQAATTIEAARAFWG